jgi:molybdate transport repressor ModE-like protein
MDDNGFRNHALSVSLLADTRPSAPTRPRPIAGGCMDVASLRYFRQIARVGSMTAAARDLGLTQPSLSSSMRRLEEDLGATLFLRHRGGVTLTEAGAELLRHSDDILGALERASRAVHGLERELIGSFVLGCNESLGAYFLPRLLPDLLRGAPKLDVSLHAADSSVVQADVLDGRIHFGLVVNPTPHPDLVMVPIFRDAIDLFVPTGSGVGTLDQAHQRIRDKPLILVGRVPQCGALVTQLAEQRVAPQRVLHCGDFELVAKLTVAGVGVGVLPRRVAMHDRTGLERLHAGLPSFVDDVFLVFRADLPRTRAVNFIKDSVVRCARELPDVGVG